MRGERQEGEGGEAAGEVLCATLRLLGQRSAAEAEMAAGWARVVAKGHGQVEEAGSCEGR